VVSLSSVRDWKWMELIVTVQGFYCFDLYRGKIDRADTLYILQDSCFYLCNDIQGYKILDTWHCSVETIPDEIYRQRIQRDQKVE